MGANLTGFMVVGPSGKIKPAVIKSAVKELKRIIKEQKWSCWNCGSKLEDSDFEQSFCHSCNADVCDRDRMMLDPVAYVNEIASLWPPDGRDVVARYMPDDPKRIIVFAGDMSWGDEPDGYGYHALKKLVRSGLSDKLGLSY